MVQILSIPIGILGRSVVNTEVNPVLPPAGLPWQETVLSGWKPHITLPYRDFSLIFLIFITGVSVVNFNMHNNIPTTVIIINYKQYHHVITELSSYVFRQSKLQSRYLRFTFELRFITKLSNNRYTYNRYPLTLSRAEHNVTRRLTNGSA